jgi:hypothetical protein
MHKLNKLDIKEKLFVAAKYLGPEGKINLDSDNDEISKKNNMGKEVKEAAGTLPSLKS